MAQSTTTSDFEKTSVKNHKFNDVLLTSVRPSRPSRACRMAAI